MKVFTNKKLWQKILIIFLIILLSKFIFSMPVHAAIDGDILLDPVMKLFVSLGDAVMSIMQDIMLQQGGESGESLIKIDGDSGFWSAVIVAAVFILGTALAIIAAIPSGGTTVIGWIGFAGSAILTIAISGTIAAVSFSTLTKIVADQFGDTYYLPMYEITPYEIFANKVLLFDVNFFNPKEDKVTKTKADKQLLEEEENSNNYPNKTQSLSFDIDKEAANLASSKGLSPSFKSKTKGGRRD